MQTSASPYVEAFKMKQREGTVERVQDANTVIGKGMFKKETDLTLFTVRAGAARGVTVTTVCSTPGAHAPCTGNSS